MSTSTTTTRAETESQFTLKRIVPLLSSAFIAANIAEACTLPMDTVRVRQMMFPKKYKKGAFHTFGRIHRAEGWRGLFNGLSSGIMRQSIFATSRIAVYDIFSAKLKEVKGEDNITLLDRACMGAMSGTIAICLANPADSIKTRLQSQTGG